MKHPPNPTNEAPRRRGRTLTVVLPMVGRIYTEGLHGFGQMAIDPRPDRVERLFSGEYNKPLEKPTAKQGAAALEAERDLAAYVARTNSERSEREGMQERNALACSYVIPATTEREHQAQADLRRVHAAVARPFTNYADAFPLEVAAFRERHGCKMIDLSVRQRAEVEKILRRTRKREAAEAAELARQTKTLKGPTDRKEATVRDWQRTLRRTEKARLAAEPDTPLASSRLERACDQHADLPAAAALRAASASTVRRRPSSLNTGRK